MQSLAEVYRDWIEKRIDQLKVCTETDWLNVPKATSPIDQIEVLQGLILSLNEIIILTRLLIKLENLMTVEKLTEVKK
jgi:hypothetical protein